MSSGEIHRAVARATGESVRSVRQRGFSLLKGEPTSGDEEASVEPQMIDWDAVDAERMALAIQA